MGNARFSFESELPKNRRERGVRAAALGLARMMEKEIGGEAAKEILAAPKRGRGRPKAQEPR